MKKYFTLSISLILVTFIISSCNKTLSLTKRHYNKGYYVDTKKTLNTEKVNNDNKVPSGRASYAQDIDVVNSTIDKKTMIDSNIIKNSSLETVVENEKFKPFKIQVKNIKIKRTNFEKVSITASKINSFSGDIQKENMESNSGDDGQGLSLFWIVILIVLLLWVLGFAFLSNVLIHLLLLLALILLILWLLRII